MSPCKWDTGDGAPVTQTKSRDMKVGYREVHGTGELVSFVWDKFYRESVRGKQIKHKEVWVREIPLLTINLRINLIINYSPLGSNFTKDSLRFTTRIIHHSQLRQLHPGQPGPGGKGGALFAALALSAGIAVPSGSSEGSMGSSSWGWQGDRLWLVIAGSGW